MREIKFRARYKVTERGFVYFSLVELLFKESPMFAEDLAEIMQFTGLKDKNGKEIYEGDIVKFVDGAVRSVKWFHQSWFPGKLEDWEVIGNIYENPDLLSTSPTV